MCAKQSFAANLQQFPLWCVSQFTLLLGAALVCSVSAVAQDKKAKDDEKEKIPPPEELYLTTADEVKLAVTYYPSNKGEDAVPVVLLHMHRGSKPGSLGSRKDFAALAPKLQKAGHAVLVPDLRGHGDSKTRIRSMVPIDGAKMGRTEYERMVVYDMTTLKNFLIKENNDKKLNIEKLVVVGAEMGASVALSWAYYDWSIMPEGNKKQGQDIKGLVLISPEKSTPGLPITRVAAAKPPVAKVFDPQLKRAFKDPASMNFDFPVPLDFRREVSIFIFVGKRDSNALRDADRLRDMLKKAKRTNLANTQKDLFFQEYDTKLQGTKLLGLQLPLEKNIELFIDLRSAKRPFPWAERKSAY